MCQFNKCPLPVDKPLHTCYSIRVVKGTPMNILQDQEQLKLINNFAEHNELTVDYVIEEFVVDGEFIVCGEDAD